MSKGFAPLYILISLAILTTALGAYLVQQSTPKPKITINSFDDCIKAGYPVMESYPRQCRTPDGKSFTEILNEEEKKKLVPPIPTPDETVNWEIYTDSSKKFSFKYPGNLYIKGRGAQIFIAKKDATPAEKLDYSDQLVEIRVGSNIRRFNLYYSAPENTLVASYGDLKIKNFMVDGYKAVEYGYDPSQIAKTEQYIKNNPDISTSQVVYTSGIIANKENMTVEISTNLYSGEFKQIFDQILSTFKFLDQSTPTCGACPQNSPPSADFCKNGKIVAGGKDSCGCQLPPTCLPLPAI